MPKLPLLCFDIDGTLVRTAGAGREALDEAFLALWGWPDATQGVHVAGSTDDVICRDVASKFGVAWSAANTPPLRTLYLNALSARLDNPARTTVLPGLPGILQELEGLASYCLLTGNWSEGATRKLLHTGLLPWFSFGVYSEDAENRNGLVPVAVERARSRGLDVEHAIVIGDTIADIECARAGGAGVIVVETGFSEPLALAAAKPDLQVPSFEQGRAAIVDFLRRRSA